MQEQSQGLQGDGEESALHSNKFLAVAREDWPLLNKNGTFKLDFCRHNIKQKTVDLRSAGRWSRGSFC